MGQGFCCAIFVIFEENVNESFDEQDDKQITAQGAQFTTSASETVKTETFDVAQNNLGYTGNHDEHISPMVALLDSLKNKLRNSKKISTDRVENLTGEYKKAQKAAELVSLKIARYWPLESKVIRNISLVG